MFEFLGTAVLSCRLLESVPLTEGRRVCSVHSTVNHSTEFVTESGTHTNNIDSRWNAVKKRCRDTELQIRYRPTGTFLISPQISRQHTGQISGNTETHPFGVQSESRP